MTTSVFTLRRLIAAVALAAGLAPAAFAAQPASDAAAAAARAALKAPPAAGSSGSGFVANHGQWESEVLFMAPIQGGRAWVTAKGIVYDFTKATKAKKGERPGAKEGLKDGPKAAKARQAERVQGHVVRLDFAGSLKPAVRSSGKLKTRLNYLLGNDASKHARNVPAYTAVNLEGLWPGVGLRLEQGPGGLALAFNAADAAALAKARVFVGGAALLEGSGEGAVVATSIGQRSLGAVAVTLGAARHAGKLAGGAVALAPGRAVAAPGVQASAVAEGSGGLIYSTFLGGGGYDSGYALAVDASGAAYVTGETASTNFPSTPGAYDTTRNGSYDAFVTKLSADGSTLVYSTFLGGGGYDSGSALAVDASGAAYVTGETESTNFPSTPGAFDVTRDNYTDAFVTKLSADGSALVYSTFLGGSDSDFGEALALDASGAAYVTGHTRSRNFPTTPGAFDTTHSGGERDAFVTKLSVDGSALVYSTFLGGRDYDYGSALAVDASGAAYVTGKTESPDFPTTPGAFDTTYNGDDAFVTKLSADGSALVYSTLLGGGNYEWGEALAVDASGAAYVTGWTYSSSDFPTTPGAFDTTYHNHSNAFVTKFSVDGSALVYSTFLGGGGYDFGEALALDASGAAYVTGYTDSQHFPTTPGAFDTTFNGGRNKDNAFVTKLSADGSALVYSTFLGGKSSDSGYALAVDASGAVYVTGDTISTDFPTTPGAFDTTYNYNNNYYDTFITKLDLNTGFDVSLTATATPTSVAAGGSFVVEYTIRNDSDEDVTGDLVFAASRNSSDVGKGQILSNTTIAAHGTRTGSYTQAVPSNAEPGVYSYALRISRRPRTIQDQVGLVITVTAPAQAGGATAWKAVPRR